MTTIQDLVGQPLYARQRLPKLRYPDDQSEVLGFFDPGQRVGTIRGWSDKRPRFNFWYIEFDNDVPGQPAVFFVPYVPEKLNMPALQRSYAVSTEAARRRNLEWWQRMVEDGTDVVTNAASAAGSGIALTVVGLGLGYVILNRIMPGK